MGWPGCKVSGLMVDDVGYWEDLRRCMGVWLLGCGGRGGPPQEPGASIHVHMGRIWRGRQFLRKNIDINININNIQTGAPRGEGSMAHAASGCLSQPEAFF